jgi:hypothetical protein
VRRGSRRRPFSRSGDALGRDQVALVARADQYPVAEMEGSGGRRSQSVLNLVALDEVASTRRGADTPGLGVAYIN